MSSARQGTQLCKKQLLCPTLIEKGPDHYLSNTVESLRVDYGPQNMILFTSKINTFISTEDKMKHWSSTREEKAHEDLNASSQRQNHQLAQS